MAPNESAPHQHHHQQAVSTAPRSRPQPTTGVIAVADATMAKANRDRGRRGATAPSVPNWLRPMKRESGRANDDRRGSSAAARSAVSASATPTPTPTAGSSSSGGRTPLPNHHDRSTSLPLPQPRPSAPPQHESESPPPPAADTRRRIVSVSSPMDAASDHPVPVACSTKRKAPAPAPEDEEQSERERDGHLHHGHVLKSTGGGGGGGGPGGGGMIWMDEDEGTRIMMEATTALKKNSTRRMTTTATQGAEVQSKRTRRAAATSDDDTETLLSWRRKTGALPPPPPPPPLARQSGPPGNPKSIGVDSAVDGVIMAEDDTAAPLEEDCDFGLNITNEGASSGKISEELARATLQEAMLAEAMIMVPPRDTARPGSDWVPEPWAHSSERGALNVRPTHEIFSPTLPHEPSSSELSDAPDLDNSHALDSDDDVTSDSDLPLALLLAQPYGQSQQSSSAKKKPQSGKKGGTKARADGFDTADVEDTSSDDTPLAARHKRSSSGHAIANAAAETPHDRSHNARGGGRVKAKKATPLRRSDAREHAATPRTTPRKVPRAERSDTSDDEASDDDLALPGKHSLVSSLSWSAAHPTVRGLAPSVRTPPRAKTACQWRVVEPPKSVVHPADAKRLSVTGIRPRVWTGGKDELIAALPALAKNRGGVAWRGLYYPTLIFSEDKGGPGLGWWKDDAWEGRRIAFSIVREVDLPLHPPVRQSVSAAHGSPFDAGCTMVDAPSLPETFPNPRATTSADNRESQAPAVPCSVNGNRESNGSSSGSPEVGPSRFSLENPPSAPSQSTCSMEVPYQRMNHSSHLDFLCDFDGDSGTLRRSVPSMYAAQTLPVSQQQRKRSALMTPQPLMASHFSWVPMQARLHPALYIRLNSAAPITNPLVLRWRRLRTLSKPTRPMLTPVVLRLDAPDPTPRSWLTQI
ncbi:hypothetical protein BJV74DRAFT_448817 [Russula compacta]|nr:hypothetical protein BJV74DRAFT_448817 [Russula compacta]